jgi:two-component system sensor histidine kinase RegB
MRDGGPSGLGLGFFIAKTLLERSGATVTLDNRERPRHGAIVKVSWSREVFERREASALALPARRSEPQRIDAEDGVH